MKHFGWTAFFQNALDRHPGCEPARAASETRNFLQLWTAAGTRTTRLPASWPDPQPVTGDWLAWDAAAERVQAVLPRRTQVSRRKAGRATGEQVLAANVDVIFIVCGLDHDFNLRRIERYLVLAHNSGATPVIVLNKADLCDDPLQPLRQLDAIAPNVSTVLVSALDPASVQQLHRYTAPGETAVLLGSSGAGKSTIVNQLTGTPLQPVQAVRDHDSRGRHTTTSRQLIALDAGWLLIDTPGLRELEPWANSEDVPAVFADIAALAVHCHFRDCTHSDEPGCAVRDAVSPDRLAAFDKLQREMAALEARQNVHAALEQKRRWKAIHKAMRNFSKG